MDEGLQKQQVAGDFLDALIDLPEELRDSVRRHIREMYPEVVKAAPATFLLSVGNHVLVAADGAVRRFLNEYAEAVVARASGIAAGTDETPQSGSAEGKSPSPKGDAQ